MAGLQSPCHDPRTKRNALLQSTRQVVPSQQFFIVLSSELLGSPDSHAVLVEDWPMPPWFVYWLLGKVRRRSSGVVSILATCIIKTNHKGLCRLSQQLVSTFSNNLNLLLA